MSYVTLYTQAIEIKHTKCQLRSRIIFSHFNSTIRFYSVYSIDSYFLLKHYCIIFSLKSAIKLYWCVYTSNKKPVFECHKLIKYRREWSNMSLMINLITPDRIWSPPSIKYLKMIPIPYNYIIFSFCMIYEILMEEMYWI